jgi:hypothetical protein
MARPGGDQYLATLCWNRIDVLSRRFQPVPWSARQPAPGVLTTARPPTPAPPTPVAAYTPPPALPVTVASGPGWLRRSGVAINGQAAYVLEDNVGRVRYYMVAQPGLNMDVFVNKPVEVFGPLVAKADLAGGGYISVGRLHLLR